MARTWTLSLVVVLVALLAASCSYAGGVEVGNGAPAFSGTGVDDKDYSLADFKDAKAIVLAFTCNHCPVAKAYEDRIIDIQKNYGPKGVQVVALCVNDVEGDRLPAMKKRAEEKEFNFPYIYDETQQSARDYGATCTPHVFLLDEDRNVVYMGAIDDNNNPEKVEKHYLTDAIDAVLAGKEPPQTVTRQRGCSIKWAKK